MIFDLLRLFLVYSWGEIAKKLDDLLLAMSGKKLKFIYPINNYKFLKEHSKGTDITNIESIHQVL